MMWSLRENGETELKDCNIILALRKRNHVPLLCSKMANATTTTHFAAVIKKEINLWNWTRLNASRPAVSREKSTHEKVIHGRNCKNVFLCATIKNMPMFIRQIYIVRGITKSMEMTTIFTKGGILILICRFRAVSSNLAPLNLNLICTIVYLVEYSACQCRINQKLKYNFSRSRRYITL